MKYRFAYFVLCAGLLTGSASLGRAHDMPMVVQARPLGTQESGVSVVPGGEKDTGFQFVSAEPALSTSVVKGAPYSLEATIDTEQTLADGNRIVHHQVVYVYRDPDGRTRREETLAAIGPWAASGTPPTLITIHDPVSGVSYFLDPQRKIASKRPVAPIGKTVMVAGGMVRGDSGDGPLTASVSSDHVVSTGKGVMVTGGMIRGDE